MCLFWPCLSVWSLQVGVFSHSAPCDGPSVLQLLCCPGAFLFDQGVGGEEGAGLHTLRGSVSGCGRGAGTSMPAGWHHQDGVQGDSLDVPLWRCEYTQHQLLLENSFVGLFPPHKSSPDPCFSLPDFPRFSPSEEQWNREESPSVNPEGNTYLPEFRCHLSHQLFCKNVLCIPVLSALLWIMTILILRLIKMSDESKTACPCALSIVDKMCLNTRCSPPVCHLIKKQSGWFEDNHLLFTQRCKREIGTDSRVA